MAKGKYAKKFNKPISAIIDEPTSTENDFIELSDILNNIDDTTTDSDDETEDTNTGTEEDDDTSDDTETTDEHIEVPDEDYEEEEPEEEPDESIQTQSPQINTVPALCTYYEGTKLMKVLSVSNNQESLIEFGKHIIENIRENQKKLFKLLEDYAADVDINSLETFLAFAKTYNMIGGISDEEVASKITELLNDGNRVAHHKATVGNTLQNQLYYSKDLKTLEEVKEENATKEPELFIENILIV